MPSNTQLARLLRWEACLNARDVGGYPTRDGGTTRWRALIRSDTLCRLTPAGQAALLDYGVRTVVDLRFPEEVARDPHPFAAQPLQPPPNTRPVLYLHLPVNAGRDPSFDAALAQAFTTAETLDEIYRIELDANVRGLAHIAAAVARAPDGGVVVHCHAGKDRTGIVTALLLSIAGVPDEVIAEDYALSAVNLAGLTQAWLESITQDPEERARLARRTVPRAEVMLATLDYLRARYGGAEPYLLAGGATADDLALLRQRLVDGAA